MSIGRWLAAIVAVALGCAALYAIFQIPRPPIPKVVPLNEQQYAPEYLFTLDGCKVYGLWFMVAPHVFTICGTGEHNSSNVKVR